MENWLLWRDATHDPYFNMAMDELLLEEAPALPVIRTYRWDRPSLSIGLSQLYPWELAGGHTVVRRPTGGGHVFHDVDLTYTAVIPMGHAISALDRMESYKVFHEAMLPMLAKLGAGAVLQEAETPGVNRATMQCFVSPSRFDVVSPGGGKYAGAAQRRTRKGILHQGSILLEASGGDWERLEGALLAALEEFFGVTFTPWEPGGELLQRARELATSKYHTEAWNHGS